jgi:hypothetical protein
MSLLDLPLEILTAVCLQLDLHVLVRVAATCKRFRHGDGGLETLELPTKSSVITALMEQAFDRPELVPSTRPVECSESWVAYLARCARQRRCREAPPIAAGDEHSLFLDATGRLLACGKGAAVGQGERKSFAYPAPVAAMAGICLQSVAAGSRHSLALSSDGRVYSWGKNDHGQLGLGDIEVRPLPALVRGLRGCAASPRLINKALP